MDADKAQRFRPKARILATLGKELISSETVALVKLVENAYGAVRRLVRGVAGQRSNFFLGTFSLPDCVVDFQELTIQKNMPINSSIFV